jgi:NADH:ubiquinone oxidoreductase subunit 5 (subunit L)/multisubunit Na+/H+ antiporter MnhA subunit
MLAAEGVEGPDPNEHAEPVVAHGHDEHHGHEAKHAPAHADHRGHGEHGGHAHEPHESPWVITVALMILALLGVFGGHFWLLEPHKVFDAHPWFEQLVSPASLYGEEVARWIAPEPTGEALERFEQVEHAAHIYALAVSISVGVLGILLAIFLYLVRPAIPGRVVAFLGQAYTAVRRKYYLDELVDATVIRLTWALTNIQKWLDENVVDGLVKLVGALNKLGGSFAAWFDRVFIDGAVNAVAMVSQVFGAAFRLVQTGRIQQYAAFAVGGAVLTAAWLILA